MKVGLICVGSLKGSLEDVVGGFEDRVGRYWRFRVDEVTGGCGRGRGAKASEVRAAEEERLLSRLPDGPGEVVALTRRGKSLGSRGLARKMADWAVGSTPSVTFVIGGAFGLGDDILRRSTLQLSLSSLTLPHEIARLVLVEQLYRAGTILKNEPYHKGP